MHELMPKEPFPRTSGILLHPTSLPSRHGVGDLGEGALRFLEFLAKSGCGLWQMLPLVPAGPGDSPYSTTSSLAGNPVLIDLEMLHRAGLLTADEITPPSPFSIDVVDYGRVKAWKLPLVERAADRLLAKPEHGLSAALAHFRDENRWVEDVALYMALRAVHHGQPWWQWPQELKDRDKSALLKARRAHMPLVDREIAIQLFFDVQWKALKIAAWDRGIRIVGDVPIYVDLDSADAWANRDQFLIDAQGAPSHVSGAPPDAFSAIGQKWGNPLYNWPRMKENGHAFFVERMKRALELFDVVRIDHFRGFSRYWSIPKEAPDARGGRWEPGPDRALFDDLERALGKLPIIAEDLGVIDDQVVALKDGVGLPGMKILVFAFGEDALHPYLPHHIEENSVVYTGTHDTNTVVGWWKETSDHVRDHVRRYLGTDGRHIATDLVRAALMSRAHTAIVPFQDVLSLDEGARMNIPGQADGNWAWRVRVDAFNDGLAGHLGDLNRLYDRDILRRLHDQARRDRAKAAAAAAERT